MRAVRRIPTTVRRCDLGSQKRSSKPSSTAVSRLAVSGKGRFECTYSATAASSPSPGSAFMAAGWAARCATDACTVRIRPGSESGR